MRIDGTNFGGNNYYQYPQQNYANNSNAYDQSIFGGMNNNTQSSGAMDPSSVDPNYVMSDDFLNFQNPNFFSQENVGLTGKLYNFIKNFTDFDTSKYDYNKNGSSSSSSASKSSNSTNQNQTQTQNINALREKYQNDPNYLKYKEQNPLYSEDDSLRYYNETV